ncbi:MAG: DEAD/DEAH box helicase [Verrucomicrobiales bacterium]|nr:DEAD/DEAH box helicase [Verrucomicrobiales bacterium]
MTSGPSPFRTWFASHFAEATEVQTAAWSCINDGKSVLVVSPPGTGKTLAAFLPILDRLAFELDSGRLSDGLQCIYVSPLRALGYDLNRNLSTPIQGVYGPNPPLRVGLRTGDTLSGERERQRLRPPHILLTTPESLSLMLSQTRWRTSLLGVRWVIVDEIHALAENKRGAHLTLSLERLEALKGPTPPDAPTRAPLQRIGLSATVFPLEEAARFLVGSGRHCEIVQARSRRPMDLQLYTPLRRNPYPPAGFTGIRLIAELARLIESHRTTLVFTNTRSGAEATSHGLREHLPQLADRIECHHASLDRDLRVDVEDRLKRGELRAVVCSTSLELGIDIGSIDLVVMVSTPKGVTRTVQRTGRAGHRLGAISRGLLMATNVNDLVECAVMARLARQGRFDPIRIPSAPLDVLAQQLMGLGCLGAVSTDEAFALVRRAWPYRTLERGDFEAVLNYLAGGGRSLEQQYSETFGKITRLPERNQFEARDGPPRRDFLQNVGTIPSDGSVRILLGNRPLGSVEESFLRRLKTGDIFSLAGKPLRLQRVGTLEAWVERADGLKPTVPRWGANKMPLSNRVGRDIMDFRSEFRERMERIPFRESPSLIPWIAERLECSIDNAGIIFRMHATQWQSSEIPIRDSLLIEELIESPDTRPPAPGGNVQPKSRREVPETSFLFPPSERRRWARPGVAAESGPGPSTTAGPWHYFFHSVIGRAANDALSRVVALRLALPGAGNILASPDDYGFVLTLTQPLRTASISWSKLFSPEGFDERLEESLRKSELLKYHFRSAAQTGLMVYRNYFGTRKTLRKVQWSSEVIFNVLSQHEPDHVLMREALRDAMDNFLDAPGARDFLTEFCGRGCPVRVRTIPQVTPFSFAMYAARIRETLLLEDPRESMERLYHQWWESLNPESSPGNGASPDR